MRKRNRKRKRTGKRKKKTRRPKKGEKAEARKKNLRFSFYIYKLPINRFSGP